jgi:RND family efflux transporter MFP subunit
MVANLVEKDLSRVPAGTQAAVEVDAFPGQGFTGRVSRVAPVFDPQTRTAEMEIEIPNGDFRLKPGMDARVRLTVGLRPDALTVPSNALVTVEGRPGVFVAAPPSDGPSRGSDGAAAGPASLVVTFHPVETGIRDVDRIEIRSGLEEGARVVTTGAGALKNGDRVLAAATRAGEAVPGAGRVARGGETR